MMYRLCGDLLLDVHVPIGMGVEMAVIWRGLPCERPFEPDSSTL